MLYLTNDSLDPAWNQAFEEYVFDHVTEDDVLLIWRNAPAVDAFRTSSPRYPYPKPDTAASPSYGAPPAAAPSITTWET